MNILFRDGTITEVVPASAPLRVADVNLIDGTDLYALPGLWDAHVHINDAPGAGSSRILQRLAAAGITNIRVMCDGCGTALGRFFHSGHLRPLPATLERGMLTGMGYPLDSTPRSVLQRFARGNATFIKILDDMSPDQFRSIANLARHAGVRIEGHVPPGLTVEEAVDEGLSTIDHVYSLIDLCTGTTPSLREVMYSRASASEFANTVVAATEAFEASKCEAAGRMLADQRVAVVPTLILQSMRSRTMDSLSLSLLGPIDRQRWREEASAQREERIAAERALFELSLRVVRSVNRGGVRILVGTDTPFPFVVPGCSAIDEVALLSEAGLDNETVVRAATITPAEHFGHSDRGQVKADMRADLVLLRGNPLVDVAHLRNPAMTVIGGLALPSSVGSLCPS